GSDITGQNIGDEFGYSVAISADGSRVIVGARFNSVSATTAGSVTVYDLTGGVWTQVGSTILGDAADDQMGWAVAISDNGERIAVGAPLNDRNGTNSGIVRIFELIGGVWIQVGSDIEGSNVGDNVGYSVALSADGKRVVISVIGNDDAAAESGQVRVFELVGSTWTQIGSGVNGVNSGDRFGWSVSMSDDGNRFAAGAVFSDPNGSSSGKVSVYEYSGTSWDQVGNAIDGEVAGDQLGRSVSLSSDGNQVAVGIPFNDNGGTSAGRVSIYDFSAGLPVELEHFQGEVHKGKVLLNWSTASEVNNWKFAVERSADGKTWQQLGEVLGQGTTYESSIYEYTDYTPLIGANYYRLRQVDWDGSFTYSTILLFDLQESIGSTFKIYPNPVSEILYFDLPVGEKVSLFNSYGQLVREENVNSQGRMDIADLPAGVYWLTTTLSGQQISQRVVKQ
ncbi:MAG: T9SS type A sorting domain-containing protein, partial [Bacteroidota bacterium]